MSTQISRTVKVVSLQLDAVKRIAPQKRRDVAIDGRNDSVAQTLRKRVLELMEARPDVTRAKLRAATQRGHSWVSEFLSGARTTNDLRLVIRIARFFGVTVGYLLNEEGWRHEDAQSVTMMGVWEELDKERREDLLHIALRLRPKRTPDGRESGR